MIVSVLYLFIILAFITFRIKKNNRGNGGKISSKSGHGDKQTPGMQEILPEFKNMRDLKELQEEMQTSVFNKKNIKKGVNKHLYGSFGKRGINPQFLADDSENWLAYQLREEQKAKAITDEMFNIKRAHEQNCDARLLKEMHAKEHGKA